MLEGKNILIGVTGGIAAYKTAYIVRLLVKEGANVKVVMTEHAKKFITPLTMATLSKNPIYTEFFNPENGEWNSHVSLGTWANLFLIAPATANTIAKMANGIADNLLLTTYLSARCPVFVAPAMDLDMLQHPATQKNISTIKSYGNTIIDPEDGELASGLSGKGRMAEPETIVEEIKRFFSKKKIKEQAKNKKIVINAGPTREAIDPVRFISNHSSGKMGIALADVAAEYGFDVTLVLGPVNIKPKHPSIKIVNVVSADEMAQECISLFDKCDIAILAAAVADYTPVVKASHKIKKTEANLNIELQKTTDIAASLGAKKRENQLLVGFALETDNEKDNAIKKLKSKNLDFIVLNSLNDKGAGFGGETNKVTIIDKNNNIDIFELKSKEEVAHDILDKVLTMIK
ncbi:MAG: bifunctional phosphopantothenoylcysteine decarboxylase/phosphopantothenate--cysteine ligase CoaBC [Bacteroidales bacterium]|nr:bifunctional phosphopantothenoylcysteine decarboxylase/phosphopantothenate--cysteine ligase CoaBC [Bacteroidales bacterium]